jgi:polyhydroxyalkanoate synthesis regulator phasin
MLKSSDGVAASDIIRSMKRMGFADDEIYDVLTGIGLPGEQVQLLIDRVSAEFEEAKLEPQTSRLATEVQKIFKEALLETQSKASAQIKELSDELQLIRSEIEKLSNRIFDLQSLIDRTNFLSPLKSRGKSLNRRRRC